MNPAGHAIQSSSENPHFHYLLSARHLADISHQAAHPKLLGGNMKSICTCGGFACVGWAFQWFADAKSSCLDSVLPYRTSKEQDHRKLE
jgi:hypothetical protein